MRLGRHTTRRSRQSPRWLGALLALLSLAPAGVLRATPSPCAAVANAAAAAEGCGTCCSEEPAAPVLDSVSCGCCGGAPAPEPARSAVPVVPLLAAPELVEFVAPTVARLALSFDARGAQRASAPPARLLHCVHLI